MFSVYTWPLIFQNYYLYTHTNNLLEDHPLLIIQIHRRARNIIVLGAHSRCKLSISVQMYVNCAMYVVFSWFSCQVASSKWRLQREGRYNYSLLSQCHCARFRQPKKELLSVGLHESSSSNFKDNMQMLPVVSEAAPPWIRLSTCGWAEQLVSAE